MGGFKRVDRLVVSSSQIDPALAFVGGSPFPGDLSSEGILIPSTPTTKASTRYLVRLCGVAIPSGMVGRIQRVRLLLTIGADMSMGAGTNKLYHFELPVETPRWHLPGGNVSFHVRQLPLTEVWSGIAQDPANTNPVLSRDPNPLTPALLGTIPGVGGYTPLNAGMPYGEPISGLGTMRDASRFPWRSIGRPIGIDVQGAVSIVLYASIYQSDPTSRQAYPGSVDGLADGICPEERFLLRMTALQAPVTYYAVGGELSVDLLEPKR